jgi:glycosyltransferase involved in cell wall biosynthesis
MGRPYVLTPHGMLDDWSMAQQGVKKRLYLWFCGNRLLNGAARIHCTARGELDQASKWFDGAKGVVVPLIFDLEAFEKLPGAQLASGRFAGVGLSEAKLLFLSRIHVKKGVECLIEAAAELKKRGKNCTVLIAGPGEEEYIRRLRALAREKGLGDQVHFLGMVRGEEKLSLFQCAALFVLPTQQENFGLALIEAMACGTAVVTTRGVDLWRELEEAGAEIVEAEGVAMARAIAGLLEDREGLEARGARGREWVFEQLNPERVAGEYEAMYREVARGGS